MAVVYQALQRRSLRKQRVFRDRLNVLESFDDVELYKKYRFPRVQILELTDMVQEEISFSNQRGGALPALLQVCIALRFYATGSFQEVLGDSCGVSQCTVSRVLARVTNAFYRKAATFIKFPDQEAANKQKQKFQVMAGFPNVFGCIDGTHIRIQAPRENEAEYINRKNYHSVNIQVICDADYKVIHYVSKWPGSVHDARMLRESELFVKFERGHRPVEGLLLGDSGYMLREWLMTPYINPVGERQQRYNDAHTKTRCTVERCIGIIKRRWHCLHSELRIEPKKVCRTVVVCFMLHNRARDLGLPLWEDDDTPPNEPPPREAAPITLSERARTMAGKATRERIVQNYF